jgi:hypothetical protein
MPIPMFNNGRLLRAQLGPRENKAKSQALLLSATDLPGADWIERQHLVMRMGVLVKPPPFAWIERAGKKGHFSAYRWFEQETTDSLLMLQVLPLVSEEDALLALSDLNTQTTFENTRFHGSILEDRELPTPILPGVESARAFLTSSESDGQVGFTNSVHLVIGSVLLAVRFFRNVQPWADSEMLAILTIQIPKLKV